MSDTVPFDNVEEAWFWFIQAQAARNDGARYAAGAGYDPRGLATFFDKLRAKYGDTGPVMTWFSTHPSNSDRVNKLTAYIAANNLSGSETGGDRLKAAQAALKKK